MNVLFVSNDPAILDEASAVRLRMQTYADAIGNLHIIVRGPSSSVINVGPLTIHVVTLQRVQVLTQLPRAIRRIILHEHIEIVSAQDPFEYGYAALQGIRGTNAVLHIQVHTDFLSPWFARGVSIQMQLLNRVRTLLAGLVLPHAKGIRVVSERSKLSLMARYDTAIVEPKIIPIALPHTVPSQVPLPERSFAVTFMVIGRLEPEKRVHDIVLALARISTSHSDVGLVIAGEGRERGMLIRLVHDLSLEQKVIFLGDTADAWGMLLNANVFVQASAYEGFGRTLIEAALASRPIITTPVGIIGEVLQSERDALVFPIGNVDTLVVHMERLLTAVQVRTTLGKNAEKAARAYLAQVHSGPAAIAADLQATKKL